MKQKPIMRRVVAALHRPARSLRLVVALAFATTLVASCKRNELTGPGALATITLTPSTASLATGATQQFTAVGKDASGTAVSITPTWTVAAGGGTITSAGLLTAGTTAGTFTVTATSGTISGTAAVTVAAGALATITVTPNPATVAPNGTQQFTAVGKDAAGNTVAITAVWSVVAGGGTISATGLFTATLPIGTFANTVKATSGAISGTATVTVALGALATITVTPNPVSLAATLTTQFTAVGKDAAGNVVAITPVWGVAAGGGTISATGLFTAGAAAGTFTNTVTATSGTIVGTATVTVTAAPGPLAFISVTPNAGVLLVGATLQFTAVGTDASGLVVAIAPVWTVAAGGGTIGATGLFTAGAAVGTFTNSVTATVGAIAGKATVIVNATAGGALATIVVTPNPATISINTTQQFIATGLDANGIAVAITPVWSVVNGGGTINAAGLLTAGATTGTFAATVKATVGAISGTAGLVVAPTAGALASITVTPNPATVVAGATQQFTAVGKDANGVTVPVTVAWAVSAAGGGTITATGLFTAGAVAGTFTNTVTATSGALAGTATVIVPGPLATITVTPSPGTVAAGATLQFTAVGKDAAGNVVLITPGWVLAAGGGSISQTGLLTASTASGTYTNTVRAIVGSIQGMATVIIP